MATQALPMWKFMICVKTDGVHYLSSSKQGKTPAPATMEDSSMCLVGAKVPTWTLLNDSISRVYVVRPLTGSWSSPILAYGHVLTQLWYLLMTEPTWSLVGPKTYQCQTYRNQQTSLASLTPSSTATTLMIMINPRWSLEEIKSLLLQMGMSSFSVKNTARAMLHCSNSRLPEDMCKFSNNGNGKETEERLKTSQDGLLYLSLAFYWPMNLSFIKIRALSFL